MKPVLTIVFKHCLSQKAIEQVKQSLPKELTDDYNVLVLDEDTKVDIEGINVRDYFAGKALSGFISKFGYLYEVDGVIKKCYELADAMIKEKNNDTSTK